MVSRLSWKITAWVFFAAGLVLVMLTSWPLPSHSIEWSSLLDEGSYFFTLDWPRLGRVGEKYPVTLTISRTGLTGDSSTAHAVLESRLEFNNLVIDPSGIVTQPVGSANRNEFRWSTTARRAGVSSGTLWIYAAAPDNPEMHHALAARSLAFRAVGPGRLTILILRWLGVVLIVLGVIFLVRQIRR